MSDANRRTLAIGLALVAAAVLSVSCGCGGEASYDGPPRAAVSGTVTLDGTPVVYGIVTFESGQGRTASGQIRDGSYSIPEGQGPNLGTYKVTILGYEKGPSSGAANEEGEEPVVGEEGVGEEGEGDDEGGGGESEEEFGKMIVPAKYNAATELEVEITSGANTHDFPLTSQ